MTFIPILLLILSRVSGQECFEHQTCSSCLEDSSCGVCIYDQSTTCVPLDYPYYPYKSCNNGVFEHTCPDSPSRVTIAFKLCSSSLFFLLVGSCATIILAVITFSSLELFCGKKSSQEITLKLPELGCTVFTLFVGTFFLWLSLSLLLASPTLPWMMHIPEPSLYQSELNVFNFEYATAFSQYNCFSRNDLSNPGRYCIEFKGSDNTKEYDYQGSFTSTINNGFALGILCQFCFPSSICIFSILFLPLTQPNCLNNPPPPPPTQATFSL